MCFIKTLSRKCTAVPVEYDHMSILYDYHSPLLRAFHITKGILHIVNRTVPCNTISDDDVSFCISCQNTLGQMMTDVILRCIIFGISQH